MVVFPELAGISAVLGKQLSLEGICVQASVLVLLGDQFKMLLRSCVLRVPGVSICVAVVVLPVLTGLSALLGD